MASTYDTMGLSRKEFEGKAQAIADMIVNGVEPAEDAYIAEIEWRERPSAYIGKESDRFRGPVIVTADMLRRAREINAERARRG
jgi:hypothetical protein